METSGAGLSGTEPSGTGLSGTELSGTELSGQRELATAFGRDGVVCVRGVLDGAGLADAALAIDAVLADPGPLAQVASVGADPGSFTEDFRRWQQIPLIERLARHSRVPEIAAALLATEQLRFYHDHVLVKEGGTRQRTPWIKISPTTTSTGPA